MTGKLLNQKTTGCKAGQMDAAFPKEEILSWHPASLALGANPEEKPPCSLLTGIAMAASQLVPTSLHQPILLMSSLGRRSVPLTGSQERKRGWSRLRQSCSRSRLSTRQFQRLDSVGVAGEAPKPEWLQSLQKDFLSHLHPRRLLFPEYEMHVFRKAHADMRLPSEVP